MAKGLLSCICQQPSCLDWKFAHTHWNFSALFTHKINAVAQKEALAKEQTWHVSIDIKCFI